jgi:hypothetical protein
MRHFSPLHTYQREPFSQAALPSYWPPAFGSSLSFCPRCGREARQPPRFCVFRCSLCMLPEACLFPIVLCPLHASTWLGCQPPMLPPTLLPLARPNPSPASTAVPTPHATRPPTNVRSCGCRSSHCTAYLPCAARPSCQRLPSVRLKQGRCPHQINPSPLQPAPHPPVSMPPVASPPLFLPAYVPCPPALIPRLNTHASVCLLCHLIAIPVPCAVPPRFLTSVPASLR